MTAAQHTHPETHDHPHPVEDDDESQMVGLGSAVLDIGDDVGALLAVVPEHLAGTEIDITAGHHDTKPPHSHDVHTGVHPRLYYGRTRHIALYPALPAGTYQLWHPHHPARLATTEVRGGHVTEINLTDN